MGKTADETTTEIRETTTLEPKDIGEATLSDLIETTEQPETFSTPEEEQETLARRKAEIVDNPEKGGFSKGPATADVHGDILGI